MIVRTMFRSRTNGEDYAEPKAKRRRHLRMRKEGAILARGHIK